MNASPVPTIAGADLPWLSVAQMIEVDRIMIEDLGITLVRMMENAGRGLAELTRRLAGGTEGLSVAVMVGGGGNGGGGMVAARHLANAGADVTVCPAVDVDRMSPVAAEQAAILRAMGIRFSHDPAGPASADHVVDALLGYSGRGEPRGRVAELVRAAEGRRIIALDSPTGLDLTAGRACSPGVTAEATLTLAAPKSGLSVPAVVGDLWLADISVPSGVWSRMGLRPVPPFTGGPLARIDPGSR